MDTLLDVLNAYRDATRRVHEQVQALGDRCSTNVTGSAALSSRIARREQELQTLAECYAKSSDVCRVLSRRLQDFELVTTWERFREQCGISDILSRVIDSERLRGAGIVLSIEEPVDILHEGSPGKLPADRFSVDHIGIRFRALLTIREQPFRIIGHFGLGMHVLGAGALRFFVSRCSRVRGDGLPHKLGRRLQRALDLALNDALERTGTATMNYYDFGTYNEPGSRVTHSYKVRQGVFAFQVLGHLSGIGKLYPIESWWYPSPPTRPPPDGPSNPNPQQPSLPTLDGVSVGFDLTVRFRTKTLLDILFVEVSRFAQVYEQGIGYPSASLEVKPDGRARFAWTFIVRRQSQWCAQYDLRFYNWQPQIVCTRWVAETHRLPIVVNGEMVAENTSAGGKVYLIFTSTLSQQPLRKVEMPLGRNSRRCEVRMEEVFTTLKVQY